MTQHLLQAWPENSGRVVLFDPKVVSSEIDDMKTIEQEKPFVSDGNTLSYLCPNDDDETSILIVVDKQPDAEIIKHQTSCFNECVLKVPSGQLILADPDELDEMCQYATCEYFDRTELGFNCKIPKGDYVVEAYELDWQGEGDNYFKENASFPTRWGFGFMSLFIAILIVLTIFGLPFAFVYTWVVYSFTQALLVTACFAVVALLIWRFLSPTRTMLKVFSSWKAVEQEKIKQYPPVIIYLNKQAQSPVGIASDSVDHLSGKREEPNSSN